MVKAHGPAEPQESVKTPHRIELCEQAPPRPKRNYQKRRIIDAVEPKTENGAPAPPKRNGARSNTLKSRNGLSNMTNGHGGRGRPARSAVRGAVSHKLTEYFTDTRTSIDSPPTTNVTVKTEIKVEIENGKASHKLTEYFPVRRSVRKTSKCVMAEKMRDLERAVREQKEDGLEVCVFPGKGRGVVARRAFPRGQYVVEYVGELIGVAEARCRERQYALDPTAGCYMYYFRHGDQQYCIDATAESPRLGRLVNHSRGGNLHTKVMWVDGPRLVLVAAVDIAAGEELTYDYGDRSRASLLHHPWLAL